MKDLFLTGPIGNGWGRMAIHCSTNVPGLTRKGRGWPGAGQPPRSPYASDAPIGLDIGGKTPAEIMVSIMEEVLAA